MRLITAMYIELNEKLQKGYTMHVNESSENRGVVTAAFPLGKKMRNRASESWESDYKNQRNSINPVLILCITKSVWEAALRNIQTLSESI
jgi:hypothetical protein